MGRFFGFSLLVLCVRRLTKRDLKWRVLYTNMPVVSVDWEVGLVRLTSKYWPTVVPLPNESYLEHVSEPLFLKRRRINQVIITPYIGNQKRVVLPMQSFDTRYSDGWINGWAIYSLSYADSPILIGRMKGAQEFMDTDEYVLDTQDVYLGDKAIENLPGFASVCQKHSMRMYKEEDTGKLFCPECVHNLFNGGTPT